MALEFFVEMRKIRRRLATFVEAPRSRSEQRLFQLPIIPAFGQRPSHPCRLGVFQILVNRSVSDRAATGDLPLPQSQLVSESQYFFELSHGQPFRGQCWFPPLTSGTLMPALLSSVLRPAPSRTVQGLWKSFRNDLGQGSGHRRKVTGLRSESVTGFIPESCPASFRNGARNDFGIVPGLPRNPQKGWRSFYNQWKPKRLCLCKERATGRFERPLRADETGVQIPYRAPRPKMTPTKARLRRALPARLTCNTFERSTENSDGSIPPTRTIRLNSRAITEKEAAGVSGMHAGTPSTGGSKRPADGCDSGVSAEFTRDGVRTHRCREDDAAGKDRTDTYPEPPRHSPDRSRPDSCCERGGGSPRVGQFQLARSIQADPIEDGGAPGGIQAYSADLAEWRR